MFVVPEWQTALFTMLSGLVDEAEEDAQTNAGVLETLITKTYVGLLLADLGLNEILEDDNDNNNTPLLCQRPVFVVPEWQTALFTMLSGLVDEAEEDAQTNAGVLETLITKTYVGLLLADLGLNEILEDDNDNNNNNGMAEEDDLAYLNSLNTHTQLQQKSDHQQNSKPTDSNNDQAAPSLGSNNNSALPSGLGQISSRTTIAPLVTLVSLARTAHNGPAISRFLLSKVLAEIGAELEKKEMINERRRRMRVWHVVSR